MACKNRELRPHCYSRATLLVQYPGMTRVRGKPYNPLVKSSQLITVKWIEIYIAPAGVGTILPARFVPLSVFTHDPPAFQNSRSSVQRVQNR